MRFDSPGRVEEVVWSLRLAELVRAENRVILNRLYNGAAPFDEAAAEQNGVQINRNFLEGVNHLSQARRQWANAFLKPGNYFTVTVDDSKTPPHKRREWAHIITRHINRALKRSPDYMEYHRANGANTILHGIAPSNYESRTAPFPVPLMVDDLLVPSETLTSFRNLDHFAIYRQWSPAQVYELTHGPKRDPGWNMPMVESELQRLSIEYQKSAYSIGYQFQPEKIEEYIKQDLGFWGSDAPPTVDVWDLYFRESDDGEGWYRRMILDTAMSAELKLGYLDRGERPKVELKNQFLYSSGKRKYANSLRQIIHCQFGDTSAVAPFRYHSVRSLGYMLFGVCELQNRLRCQFTQAVFEQLMWFFRVSGDGDFTRLKKALFSHMGVIPNGISFVTATERFKPDHQLIQLLLSQNQQLMGQSSASFTQDYEQGAGQKEMTATEVMARANAVNALVSGMLNLAYTYESYAYREQCRRFCIKDSQQLVVKQFRKNCLRDGVPAEMLDSDRWDIEPERVLGGGNKQLEVAQAQQLIAMRPNLNPRAQQMVDHIAIEAFTDDPALAEDLVPMQDIVEVSEAKHAAMLSVGTIMQGGAVQFTEDQNRRDIVETLLVEMGLIIQRIQRTGMPMMHEVIGLQNLGAHIEPLVEQIAQDDREAERTKVYADNLGNMMNVVKGWQQQLAQQQKASMLNGQNGQAGEKAAETAAKIQSQQVMAEAKAANSRESHAQKTAQRQVQFEAEEQRKTEAHNLEVQRELERQGVEDINAARATSAEIRRNDAKSDSEPKKEA